MFANRRPVELIFNVLKKICIYFVPKKVAIGMLTCTCMHMHAFNMHKGCDWFSHTKPLVKKILVFYASALLSLFSAIFRPIRPLGCFFSLVTHQIVFAIWI